MPSTAYQLDPTHTHIGFSVRHVRSEEASDAVNPHEMTFVSKRIRVQGDGRLHVSATRAASRSTSHFKAGRKGAP